MTYLEKFVTLAATRHVRTAEGAAKYGVPIGTAITARVKAKASGGVTPKAPKATSPSAPAKAASASAQAPKAAPPRVSLLALPAGARGALGNPGMPGSRIVIFDNNVFAFQHPDGSIGPKQKGFGVDDFKNRGWGVLSPPKPKEAAPVPKKVETPKAAEAGSKVPDSVEIADSPGRKREREAEVLGKKPKNFDSRTGPRTADEAYYSALASGPAELDDDRINALEVYTGNGYEEINQDLRREDNNSNYKEEIKHLDSVLEESRLLTDVVTYRGMNVTPAGIRTLVPGIEFSDPAYVSTSSSDVAASQFGSTIFEITVPQGSRAVAPSRYTGTLLEEREVLLPRGSRFRIKSVSTENGKTRVKVTAITDEERS